MRWSSRYTNAAMGCAFAGALSLAAATPALAGAHPVSNPTDPLLQIELAFEAINQAMGAAQNRLSPTNNAFDIPGAPADDGDAGGMSGGDDPFDWSGWSNVGVGRNENTFAATRSEGWNFTKTIGADTPLGDVGTGGVLFSLSLDRTNTTYNSGSIEYTGATVAPYASFSLNDWLSADMSFGGSIAHSNQNRLAGAVTVTGDYQTTSVFGSAGLSASKWMGYWLLSGRAGVNGSNTNRAAFTESDGTVNAASSSTLVQGSLGGTVGYWAAPALISATATYVYDLAQPTPPAGAAVDRDELKLSAGMTFYGSGEWENLTGGVSVSKTFLRAERESTSAEASIRMKFQ